MAPPVAIILLAAGASRRMGGPDKLLMSVEGTPLLARMAGRARATGAPVFVTLPASDTARAAALDGLAVQRVPVPDAASGMSASIRAGISALPPGTPGALVMLADMPDVTTADLHALLRVFDRLARNHVVRATDKDGTPGHPVVFPSSLFGKLKALQGDTGARDLLKTEDVALIPLPGRHALTDLDTPQDWQNWQRQRA